MIRVDMKTLVDSDWGLIELCGLWWVREKMDRNVVLEKFQFRGSSRYYEYENLIDDNWIFIELNVGWYLERR